MFDGPRIFLVKPSLLGQWTRTAALNDAAEIHAHIAEARQQKKQMSQDASSWIPLFPEDEVAFILTVVLRCSGSLKKKHDLEREDQLSNRLRWLIRRDMTFRQSGMRVDREVPVFDDDSDSEDPIGQYGRFPSIRLLSKRRWRRGAIPTRLQLWCARHAAMKPLNSGCGLFGLLWNSGWNWQARNHG